MATVLSIENVFKNFGPNPALKSVSFDVRAGEVHGLVGENGSGKSTLLNILCGHPVIRDTGGYTGTIRLDGKAVRISSPRNAIELGIGTVHQEFTLLPGMTVSQNIALGRESLISATRRLLPDQLALVDTRRDRKRAIAALQMLGASVEPSYRPADLPVNLRQYVEIAREVCRTDLRVLILDEPTATLGREDAASLLATLKRLAQRGAAIVFVSHRLEEVVQISDSVTVLRDGGVTASFQRQDADFGVEAIIHAMLGRTVPASGETRPVPAGSVVMEFQDWRVAMPGENITGLDLQVRQGEILGVTGLSGHGKMALGYGLVGMFPTSGSVSVDGCLLDTSSPLSAVARDVYFLPDDRRSAGLLLDRSITENVVFHATQHKGRFVKYPLGRLGYIDWKSARSYVRECVERYDIRCRSIHQPVGLLSGGNQQKVCIARVLGLDAHVLVASEPTRGIDIGARQVILRALLDANRRSGTSIICISSELSDLKQICDRVVVMHEGIIRCELPPTADDSAFTAAFSGELARA